MSRRSGGIHAGLPVPKKTLAKQAQIEPNLLVEHSTSTMYDGDTVVINPSVH
jgi:hypothetical protein